MRLRRIYDASPSRRLYEPEAVIAGSTCPPSLRLGVGRRVIEPLQARTEGAICSSGPRVILAASPTKVWRKDLGNSLRTADTRPCVQEETCAELPIS